MNQHGTLATVEILRSLGRGIECVQSRFKCGATILDPEREFLLADAAPLHPSIDLHDELQIGVADLACDLIRIDRGPCIDAGQTMGDVRCSERPRPDLAMRPSCT